MLTLLALTVPSLQQAIVAIVVLIVVGVVLKLVLDRAPIDPAFKTAIYLIIVLLLGLWILHFFGIL